MKTYETWQVVKALTEHRDWTAVTALADGTTNDYARADHDGDVVFSAVGCPCNFEFTPNRSDWHLCDHNGNEVTDYE